MGQVVVAVDAGGTSTRCVVVESGGRCLGFAKTGSGNPVSAGARLAAESFGAGIGLALERAGVTGDQLDGVVFSMAGGIVGTEMDLFTQRLRALGIDRQPVIKGDLLGSYCSGTYELDGYALVAGTGAGAARVEGGKFAVIADALGWLIGDNGSGFWIGTRVVRAAFDDLGGRGPHTALSALVLSELGMYDDGTRDDTGRRAVVIPALRLIYAMRPVELSRFAKLAFDAAADEVASSIVGQAARELARTLGAVAAPSVRGPVVLAGGVCFGNPGFVDAIAKACAGVLPASEFVTVSDGTLGAAVLALREAGEVVDRRVFETIRTTLAALVAAG